MRFGTAGNRDPICTPEVASQSARVPSELEVASVRPSGEY